MKKSLLTLTHALAFAAITFSLAVCAQAQTVPPSAASNGQPPADRWRRSRQQTATFMAWPRAALTTRRSGHRLSLPVLAL
ncbi:MAG TPA: hypothetical protein VHW45_18260 [Candidatus Sulfotelmatobacter sp.]|nr:hypothetical protein [Candidatus Sulfotelmatobacter sp.]